MSPTDLLLHSRSFMMHSPRLSSRTQATERNVTFASRNEIVEISGNHPKAGVVRYDELSESEQVDIEVHAPEETIAVKENASPKRVQFAETGDLVEFEIDDPPTALFRIKNSEEQDHSFAEKEVSNVNSFPATITMRIYEALARVGVTRAD
ncbi:hypothetical protein VNI00_006404 [Paramarasmius palmivorus]|uniref:Uncharacterized protein n=1 Tax=Paramarasmius palmivorus TaxID=297713 RepID=A0AAW0D9R3_9AGAR